MHQRGHSNGDTPGGPAGAQPPPFSSQRESRALSMHQHSHSNGDTPSGWALPQPPFSSQRESRALPMHQHSRSNGDTPGGWPVRNPHSRRNGNPEPSLCTNTVIATETPPAARPAPNPRHSRRNGNPEPSLCANTATATEICWVDGQRPTPVILPAEGIQSPFRASLSGDGPFSVIYTWAFRDTKIRSKLRANNPTSETGK